MISDFFKWLFSVSAVACPYCACPNRLDPYNKSGSGGCLYNKENPAYAKTGGDPPCLCDAFACQHERQLGIRC